MKKLLVGLMAAAVMMPAGEAAADGTFSVCAPGAGSSLYACASANVNFLPNVDPTTGGRIVLQVTNQGLWNGSVFSTTLGYAITGIGITHPTILNPALDDIAGDASVVGTPEDQWDFVTTFDGFSVQAGAATDGGVNGGIWSCAGPGAGSEYYRTCNEQYVEFTFTTDSQNWFNPEAKTSSNPVQ